MEPLVRRGRIQKHSVRQLDEGAFHVSAHNPEVKP